MTLIFGKKSGKKQQPKVLDEDVVARMKRFFEEGQEEVDVDDVDTIEKAADLTDEERSTIIEAVEERPALWNVNDPSYNKLKIKAKAKLWDEIAGEVSSETRVISAKVAQASWRGLKDYFHKVRKSKEKGTGVGTDDVDWQFYPSLEFLLDVRTYDGTRQRQTTLDDAETPRRTRDEEEDPAPAKKRKTTNHMLMMESDERLVSAIEKLSAESTPNAPSRPEDESGMMGAYVASVHRKLIAAGKLVQAQEMKTRLHGLCASIELSLAREAEATTR